jgi:hypothetical protein
MAVQFTLIDQTGARPKMVLERTVDGRVDVPEAAPDALVRGCGKVLAEILDMLTLELQTASLK